MAAFTSKADGNWSASGQTTWTEAGVPADGDTVTYSHAITVDVDTTVGSSPSDSTTYVLTRAAGGSLTVAAGKTFVIRGNWNNGAGDITLAAAAVIEFDSSQADTPTTGYKWNFAEGGTLTANSGSINSRNEIRSNASGGGFYCANLTSYDWITDYCDYTRCGKAGVWNAISEVFWITPNLTSSADTFSIQHAIFNYCSLIKVYGLSVDSTFRLANCTWQNSLAVEFGFGNAYCLFLSDATAGTITGTRAITGCVFDNTIYPADMDGFTFTGNLCSGAGGALYAPAGTPAEDSGNLYVSTNIGELGAPTINSTDNYFLMNSATANPHFFSSVAASANVSFDGCIFEYTGPSVGEESGDLILSATGATGIVTAKNCIVLPNSSDGGGIGCLTNYIGASATVTFVIEHNTHFATNNAAQALFYMGENPDPTAQRITSFKSNLVWGLEASKAYKCGGMEDIVLSANADYNWGWNTVVAGDGYANTFSSGTPDTNGGNGDPQFVDSTRNIAAWDSALGGAGTTANALTELKKRNDPTGYDSRYTVAALISYVKEGFKVRNASLHNAGHDGTTIGAGDYQPSQFLALSAGGSYLTLGV